MNLATIEQQARAAWDSNPALRYAFADFGHFLQTRELLADARDDELRELLPTLIGQREAELDAARHRMALVRSPGEPQASARHVERQGSRLVVWVYGRLTVDGRRGVSGAEIQQALDTNRDAAGVIFRISSGGGHVDALQAIQTAIAQFPGRTIALVDHFAFSAAADLAVCCDRLVMRRNAVLMLHRIHQTVTGNCDELLAASRELRTEDARMTTLLYQTRRRASLRVICEAVESARYIGAAEALALGLADAIAPALLDSDELIAAAIPEVIPNE